MATRFKYLDQQALSEHCYLEPGDHCFYLGEYLPSRGDRSKSFWTRPINSLVLNFKWPQSASTEQLIYKNRAIEQIAQTLIAQIRLWEARTGKSFTLVLIPTSKSSGDVDYDDRCERLKKKLDPYIDCRMLIRTTASMSKHHLSKTVRPNPSQLLAYLELDVNVNVDHLGDYLVLFDDVLTNGCHFKACQQLLLDHFNKRAVGVFVGRTKHVE